MKFGNKKGDIPVTLFVIMVIVLTGFTLFGFAKSNLTSSSRFNDARFVERADFWEEGARFDLTSAGERAFAKSYSENIIDSELESKFLESFKNDEIIKSRYSGIEFKTNAENGALNLKADLTFNYKFNTDGGNNSLVYNYQFDKTFYPEK